MKLGHSVKFLWREKTGPLSDKPNFYRLFVLPLVQYAQLKNELKKNAYDVLIISQPHCWLAVKKLKRKYPHTLFVNRTHGWEARIEKEAIAKEGIKSKLMGAALLHCCTAAVKYSDAVVCASSSDSDFIKQAYPLYASKVFYSSYGLDDSYLGLTLKPKENGPTKFLYAGQYLVRKGIDDIRASFLQIHALGKFFELNFVVHENSVNKVKEEFSFLPDHQLRVFTWMPRKELLDLYSQNDVFLMPSYGEGFGKTSLEAMACGLCVLGYREGALADFAENALVTEVGNKEGLLKMVLFAIDHVADAREYGQMAYGRVQHQTWEKTWNDTMQYLLSIKAS
jgi:glycosyltransferase involved in cell wall biosynthesis